MSDDYRVQVTISLPPSGSYAKGDMLNVRGTDADDLFATLTALFDADAAQTIIGKFRSFALTVPGSLSAEEVAAELRIASGNNAASKSWQQSKPSGGYRSVSSGGGGGGAKKNATPKQLGLIENIATEKGLSLDSVLDIAASGVTSKGYRPKGLEQLSSFEASKLIDLLREHEGNVAV